MLSIKNIVGKSIFLYFSEIPKNFDLAPLVIDLKHNNLTQYSYFISLPIMILFASAGMKTSAILWDYCKYCKYLSQELKHFFQLKQV